MIVKVIYRDGAFVLEETCGLPRNAEVQLIVQGPVVLPPLVLDPAEKKRILVAMAERMRNNPLPLHAPRFTRDELHDRR